MNTEDERLQVNDGLEKSATLRMAIVGILGNIFLAVFKLIAGIIGNSSAMLSDAIHTVSDVFATIVAFIGVSFSKKKADREHPYGHERIECVASLILSFILFATGIGIGWNCLVSIFTGAYKTDGEPGMLPVIAAAVSIITKEAMFWYTMYYAKKLRSSVFKADAWHHRSDALSSIGALVGIIGARNGFPILDKVAGIIICILIIGVALEIFRDAVDKVLDTACDEEFEQRLMDCIEDFSYEHHQKIGIDTLRTRRFGEKIYAELEINMDGNMSLHDAHEVAEQLHDQIEKSFLDIKHVMIHVNPS